MKQSKAPLTARPFPSAKHGIRPTPNPSFHPALAFRGNGKAVPAAFPGPVGITPATFRSIYGIDQIRFGAVTGDGAGQTIAIIDAYNDPNIVTDLQQFDSQFGLPDTVANPIASTLTVVNQTGGSTLPSVPPPSDPDWSVEESLDVEWAHAVAPAAKLLLVECNSASFSDLVGGGVAYARTVPGVTAVSMSFGGNEDSTELSDDGFFTTPAGHAGVTFLASTGDAGQPAGYPSVSPNVVAVGGTSVTSSGEVAWSGGGGGVSSYEAQPAYQANVVTQNHAFRTAPDVSLDADPNSGVAVYDSYDFGSSTPWDIIGGTSLSSPAWAGLIAIANQGRSLAGLGSLDGPSGALPRLYNLPAGDFRDITVGNNGFAAGAGYDLATGLGVPVANRLVNDLAHDPAGPQVTRSSPLGNQAGPVGSVSFTFSQAMDPTSFSVGSGVDGFTGPGGANLGSRITGFAWGNNNQTLTINFTPVSGNGAYALTIGPNVRSASGGAPMDQNFNGVAGETSDTYTATFNIQTAAGPDAYGYSAAPYPFENLSLTPGAAGVTSVLAGVDDGSAAVDLGINSFNFYGASYTGATSLYVDSNGFLTFGSGGAGGGEYNNADLTSDPSQAAIAPLWDDWASYPTKANEQVLYAFRNPDSGGKPQQLVVEWHQVENQGAVGTGSTVEATFQAILQLNTGSTAGQIIFNYPNLNLNKADFNNGASATVGVKNAGSQAAPGTSGSQTLLASLDDPTSPLVGTGKAIRVATTPPPSVAGRYVFYNNSSFDGNSAAAGAADDAAVATDKQALLPGHTGSFANYTSYTRGINGVMIDVSGLPPGTALSAADFSFRVGNSSTPSAWAAGPSPASVTVRRGAGVNGSDRIVLTWADGSVLDQWLQVTVSSDAATGLSTQDVFYFGNAVGETGNSTTDANVDTGDDAAVRANYTFLGSAPVTSAYDFNRDGRVDTADESAVRSNYSFLNPLKLISV